LGGWSGRLQQLYEAIGGDHRREEVVNSAQGRRFLLGLLAIASIADHNSS